MEKDDKDKKKALDKLISETLPSAVDIDPEEPPHRAKDRARRQAEGELSAEEYARETAKKKPRK